MQVAQWIYVRVEPGAGEHKSHRAQLSYKSKLTYRCYLRKFISEAKYASYDLKMLERKMV